MTPARTPRRTVSAVLVVVAGLSGCTARPAPAPEGLDTPPVEASVEASTAAPALPPVDCASSIKTGPLPGWARHGFTGDGSSFRHVEGLGGAVVGVVFGYPLTSPPRPDRSNKILWVAQDRSAGRLTVQAQLAGTGRVVTRDVGFGGGQSVIDLPKPGCWRMTLRWGDRLTDTVDLPYVASR